jgi:hypothetical protein
MILREKRSRGKPKGFVTLRPLQGRIAAVHPEAGGTWLCVQHEEDGANVCTCADESIWRQFFPDTAARFNEGP